MSKQHKLQIIGIALGAGYGLLLRAGIALIHGPNASAWFLSVMSLAFVAVVPFSMGYLTVAIRAREARVGYATRIFAPWLVVLLVMIGCALAAWEGTICILMMTPIALLMGSFGGLTAGFLLGPSSPEFALTSMLLIALLPFAVGWTEPRIPPSAIRSVESDVLIHAAPQEVWQNIERVRPIADSELPRSWNRSIGFPRPMEATLSRESVGGVRHATFAGNVLFIETIDTWEPQKRLGFSIHADTSDIPPTTLDEHVTVGGPYFDVLHGEYVLEPHSNGETLLRLISRHRVSTNFNWYARLWTDGVMRDVQKSILYVIKNRCEAPAGN